MVSGIQSMQKIVLSTTAHFEVDDMVGYPKIQPCQNLSFQKYS